MTMKETHKPHIERLPVTAFPAYPITDKELAVTIPLFHSDIDSATLKPSTNRPSHIYPRERCDLGGVGLD